MSTRIWLKSSAEKSLNKSEKKKWDKDVYTLENGVEVVADDTSGEKYVVVHANPLDPSASMPRVAHKYIKRVTYTDHKYYEGFRTDGIYKLKGATAKVETVENYSRPYHDHDNGHLERYQSLTISAGSIQTLREIYTQVRQGKLKPSEDWGTHLVTLEQREREAVQKAAEVEASQTEH